MHVSREHVDLGVGPRRGCRGVARVRARVAQSRQAGSVGVRSVERGDARREKAEEGGELRLVRIVRSRAGAARVADSCRPSARGALPRALPAATQRATSRDDLGDRAGSAPGRACTARRRTSSARRTPSSSSRRRSRERAGGGRARRGSAARRGRTPCARQGRPGALRQGERGSSARLSGPMTRSTCAMRLRSFSPSCCATHPATR
jgi:hypothetical protein